VVSVHLTSLHIPFHYYSLLWTINGLLIVFGQPVVTHFGARFALPKVVMLGVSLFAASFFLLDLCANLCRFCGGDARADDR